ncbi:MAG: hypothetical protein KF708_24270 [Pirellulales bacterium]|nr:hypothetical protein [Pirellulales bacterium]
MLKISKRYLIQVAARNLGLIMRKLFGMGTPRGLQKFRDLAALVYLCMWATWYVLRTSLRDLVALHDPQRSDRAPRLAFIPPSPKRTISTGC